MELEVEVEGRTIAFECDDPFASGWVSKSIAAQ